jgi:HSP20 family molecular chaperone IbpA
MAEEKTRITADVCSCVDEENNHLILEFDLPGVKKEEIVLMMQNDSFTLRAPRGDMEYVNASVLCCPVMPEKAETSYVNGVLTVTVPFKDPMADMIEVPIS